MAVSQKKVWNQIAYDKEFTTPLHLELIEPYLHKNSSILDVGCGYGRTLNELYKNGYTELFGIDFSEKMIEISKKRNPSAKHLQMDASELYILDSKYDIIVCTHSMPYYKEPKNVFKHLNNLLSDEGKLLIGFASGDSIYDKFILGFVKLTTGKANYPSDNEFRAMIFPFFEVENLKIIRKKFFMPRIAVYTLKKVKL